MGRREKPLDTRTGPLACFADDLRKLRAAAGNPSYRHMAGMALYSPSVLSEAAGGHRLPTLPVTVAFVKACGGDTAEWERRWREVRGESNTQPPSAAMALPDPPSGPADPARPRPSQLPIGPHDFVGREAAIDGALSTTGTGRPPLVIRGPVGIGKTAFALRFAHMVVGQFPDGQLCADMRAGQPDEAAPLEVMTGFLHALGVPAAAIPQDDMHRIGLYRSILAERRVIVLLDNVRDERQVRPLLARSATSQILVTSRSRLLGLDGVRRVTLGPLSRTESIDLLQLLIGTDRVRAEHAAALKITEFCAYMPLAVTIAGRKIAGQPGRRLTEVAGRLTAGVNVANWLRIGDIGLAEAVLPAYLSLPPMGKHVVHMLGRGCDDVSPAELAQRLHISVDSAEHVMDSLVDSGLLYRVPNPERYILPRLIGHLMVQETGQLAAGRTLRTASPTSLWPIEFAQSPFRA